MADLEFTGGLDLTEALSAIDDLATSATASLSDVSTIFASSLAEAGAAALADIAGASAEVPITADIAPAQAEVATLVSSTDAETATIAVEADTSGADQAVSDLGSSADGASVSADKASGSFRGLEDSAGLVAGSAALAKGEVGGLKEVVGGAGIASAGAVVGVAALAGGIFELATKGVEATSAEQRFNTIVGETAKAVETVNVGTLSEDLGKLAVSFGSTDTNIKNTVSSLFQLALNSGASKDQAAGFSNEIVALSARAVSLNPQLGDLADVADSLGTRIARGGRFAAAFGISLSAAEINTKALGDTGKSSASDLTIYEKATAAAQLATDKYGSSLGTVVAEGAKNAANEQKSFKAELEQSLESLGKPLVAPLFDAIRASLPDVVAIAKPLGEIGIAVLPAVAAAAGLAAPPLKIIAGAIHDVPAPALAAAAAVVILSGAVHALAVSEEEGAASTGLFGGAIAALGAEVTVASISIGTAIPLVAAFVAGYALTMEAAHLAGIEIHTYADLAKTELTDAQRVATLSGKALTDGFNDLAKKATDAGSGALGPLGEKLKAFRDIADVNITTAVKLANSTDHNTDLYHGMLGVLQQVANESKNAGDKTDILANAQHAAAGEVDITGKAFQKATAYFGDFTTQVAANAGLTSTEIEDLGKHLDSLDKATSSAFASSTSLVSDFKDAWGVSTDDIINDLNKQVDAASKWSINLTTLARDGIDQGLIEQLRAAGPKAEPLIDGLLNAVANGSKDAINNAEQSLQTLLGNVNTTLDQMEISAGEHAARIQQVIAAKLADAATTGTANLDRLRESNDTDLSQMATAAEQQMGRVGESIIRIPGVDPPVIITITAEVQQALDAIATVNQELATLLTVETPAQRTATLQAIAYAHAEGGYIPARAGGVQIVAEAGYDEVVVSPRNIPGAIVDLQRLGVLNKLVPAGGAQQSGAASGGGGGGSISVGQVVLQQASTNPVREAIKAGVALRDGASLVKL